MTILPAIRDLKLQESTPLSSSSKAIQTQQQYESSAGFIRQARLLSARKDAEKLISQHQAVRTKQQKDLQKKVKKVTNLPLLEGGLYEYRRNQIHERMKKLWKLKALKRIKVRLHEYGPVGNAEEEPVVYLHNVDGIKSLYKFRDCDVFVPARRRVQLPMVVSSMVTKNMQRYGVNAARYI